MSLFYVDQNARIVLEEFQTVLHSPDSIAPVGVLHPLAFHLEKKEESSSLASYPEANNVHHGIAGLVYEVKNDGLDGCEGKYDTLAHSTAIAGTMEDRLQISAKQKIRLFSISCWLQDPCESSSGRYEKYELTWKHITLIE